MNFYLEEITGDKKRLNFPIIPDEVEVTSGANVVPLNIIKSGEAKIPRGEKATGYSWDGLLPGNSMKNQAFINTEPDEWKSATDIIKILEKWKRNGTPLKFVCGKFINADVFIETFNRRYFGQNHCKYDITLTKYPALTVSVSPAPKKTGSGTGGDEKAVGKKGKINKDKVVVRSGPGSTYKKITTLKNGTEVTIYAVSGNWYKIKESGGTGNLGEFVKVSGTTTLPDVVLAQYGNFSQDEWWVCATYVTITGGKPTKKTPTLHFTPGVNPWTGSDTGGSGSGGKKKKTPKTPKTTKDTGKKPITVTIPKPPR